MRLSWTPRSVLMGWISMLIVLMLGGSGCAPLQGNAGAKAVSERHETCSHEMKAWEDGMQAFEGGDYQSAAVAFESLTETASTEGLFRKALYALACTRLILAQTPKEFEEALGLWDCWTEQAPDGTAEADPRMLSPFLDRVAPPGLPEGSVPETVRPKKKMVVRDPAVSRDLATCKGLLQTRDKELDRIKAKLETRDKEIRRLKHQIESLEAIHLKIQEKQKEISSP